MKSSIQATILTLILTAASFSTAEVMMVSIAGFGSPATFTNLDPGLNLRVSEVVPSAGPNASTHVLIDGLFPLHSEMMYYASTYSGINVDNGETQDEGVLYLEMPGGSPFPQGVAVSQIAGAVKRSGSWADYSLNFPATSVGNSSGDGDYGSGTLSMTLSRGSEVFIGNTTYTVLDTDTIEIEPFTLSIDGGSSTSLDGSILIRDGNRYYGTVTNLSPGAAYDSLLFSIEFTNIPDTDMDGIPDIADDNFPSGLVVGQYNQTPMGQVWGYSSNIGYSPYMGYIYLEMPFVYHSGGLGWFYFAGGTPLSPGTAYWFHSQTLGWVYANDGYNGYFQAENQGWAINSFLDPTL